jgi:hypothetical protein
VQEQRTLVLSVACKYQPYQLAAFVNSWQQYLPGSDLVVIGGELPEETDRYLDGAGARLVPADFNLDRHVGWRKAWYQLQLKSWLRLLYRTRRLFGSQAKADVLQSRIAEAAFHLFSQRFFHYRRYLAHFGWKYSHVLLVDMRDTVFQCSPFPCEGLHVFAENELIGTSHFARRWFQLSYGAATFRRLSSRSLLCAGVTLGDVASVRRYLDLNCAESLRVFTVNDVDQAIHNYIIHERLMPATIHAYGEGVAINLNAVALSSLNIGDKRLLDTHGHPYAIVHQYDRVPGLTLNLQP